MKSKLNVRARSKRFIAIHSSCRSYCCRQFDLNSDFVCFAVECHTAFGWQFAARYAVYSAPPTKAAHRSSIRWNRSSVIIRMSETFHRWWPETVSENGINFAFTFINFFWINYHFEFDIVTDTCLLQSGRLLLILQHILVATLNDSQCCHFLLQRRSLIFLFLFLLVQITDVIDRSLKNRGFAQFVSGSFVLLTRRHQILHAKKSIRWNFISISIPYEDLAHRWTYTQCVVSTFDGISSFLFGLSVCFSTSFLIAEWCVFCRSFTPTVIIIFYRKNDMKNCSI